MTRIPYDGSVGAGFLAPDKAVELEPLPTEKYIVDDPWCRPAGRDRLSADIAGALALADEMAKWEYPRNPRGADDCLHQCAFSEYERDTLVRAIRGAAQTKRETCIDCGKIDPCDDDCPNFIEPPQATPEPVAYVPLSQAPDSLGEPIWREVFAAKWLGMSWQGFKLMPLYGGAAQPSKAGDELLLRCAACGTLNSFEPSEAAQPAPSWPSDGKMLELLTLAGFDPQSAHPSCYYAFSWKTFTEGLKAYALSSTVPGGGK